MKCVYGVLLAAMSLVVACEKSPTWPSDGRLEATEVRGMNVTLQWPQPLGEVKETTIRQGTEVVGQVEQGQSFVVSGLKGKTEYTFSVVATSTKGKMSDPLVLNVTTSDADPPQWDAEASLNASVESLGALGARVVFTWTPAKDDTAVEKYKLMRGEEVLAEVTEPMFTYQSVEVDGDYSVIAQDAAGNWSETGPTTRVWANNRGMNNLLRNEGLVAPRLDLR